MTNEVNLRSLTQQDWFSVSRIYAEGIATGIATFETEVLSWNAVLFVAFAHIRDVVCFVYAEAVSQQFVDINEDVKI